MERTSDGNKIYSSNTFGMLIVIGEALPLMDLTNKKYQIADRLMISVSSTISGYNNLGNEIKSKIEELKGRGK